MLTAFLLLVSLVLLAFSGFSAVTLVDLAEEGDRVGPKVFVGLTVGAWVLAIGAAFLAGVYS